VPRSHHANEVAPGRSCIRTSLKARFSTHPLSPPQSNPHVSYIPCTNLRAHWYLSNASQLLCLSFMPLPPPVRAHCPTTPMFVAFSTPKTLVRSFQLYMTRSRGFLRSRYLSNSEGPFFCCLDITEAVLTLSARPLFGVKYRNNCHRKPANCL
jgi:hypothetical protein